MQTCGRHLRACTQPRGSTSASPRCTCTRRRGDGRIITAAAIACRCWCLRLHRHGLFLCPVEAAKGRRHAECDPASPRLNASPSRTCAACPRRNPWRLAPSWRAPLDPRPGGTTSRWHSTPSASYPQPGRRAHPVSMILGPVCVGWYAYFAPPPAPPRPEGRFRRR